ncbi:MAG: HAD family phosphatase [Bacteroidales bacterium]|nr:HAD family phosphatase [Bacteroidales bacterium]
MAIKNIIFDLGGVIYDIRYENIADKFRSYGITDFEKLYSKASQTDSIDLFEEGKITPAEFRDYLRGLSPVPLTDEQIDEAWNAILIGIPKERLELLGMLRLKYNIFLYSNTNQINYDKFTTELKAKYGFDVFEVTFKKAYFSQILQIRKPKLEGFRAILAEQGLKPEETLFIDDSPQHIEAARKVGINAYHLTGGETMEQLFMCNLELRQGVV